MLSLFCGNLCQSMGCFHNSIVIYDIYKTVKDVSIANQNVSYLYNSFRPLYGYFMTSMQHFEAFL